ncbi:hypothetical protein HY384_04325 [Candidatus Daviesbacteria bacterium]|nr:hypothetical protein [Candidatus Daviesbacteria bacterium]
MAQAERPTNGEALQPQVALTEGQRRAAQGVLKALDTTSERRVVFLEGLGGTGKDFTIDALTPYITAKGAFVNKHIEISLSIFPSADTERTLREGHVVGSGDLRQQELLQQTLSREYPDNKLVTVPLQGMTLFEALNYVRAIKGEQPRLLTDEQLAASSLGIHEVAQMLVADPHLPEDLAVRVAGSHLGSDLQRSDRYHDKYPEAVKRYLRIEPTAAMVEITQQQGGFRQGHLYDRLGRVLKNKFDLQQKGGDEESPLFVAPESVDIYNRLLQSDAIYEGIRIFVPEVPMQDFPALARAFGLEATKQYRAQGYSDDGYRDGTRVRMFKENERKVDTWFKEPDGKIYLSDAHEGRHTDEIGRKYEQRFRRGELPVQARHSSEPVGRMYFHTYENAKSINVNRGWMVESWLQQRGLPYITETKLVGSYTYNPETQSIEPVKSK